MNTRLASIVAALVISGCTSDPVIELHGKLAGVYVLRTVNGVPLPAVANGQYTTPFSMVADTIRVYEDGFGVESTVTSRPGDQQNLKQASSLHFTNIVGGAFDIEYECNDVIISLASCIAPPHYKGVQSALGMVLNYSIIYKTPMVFERVGPAAN